MKNLLVLVVFLMSAYAFAEGKNFETKKSMAVKNVEKRISSLQAMKSCMSAATDNKSMMACRKKHKELMKDMKDERMAHKEERKAKKAAKKTN